MPDKLRPTGLSAVLEAISADGDPWADLEPPPPEDRAEIACSEIAYWAEELRAAGEGEVADRIMAAIQPRRPRGRPVDMEMDDQTWEALGPVLQAMKRNNNRRGAFEAACRNHCPSGITPDAFKQRIARVLLRELRLRPRELKVSSEQK